LGETCRVSSLFTHPIHPNLAQFTEQNIPKQNSIIAQHKTMASKHQTCYSIHSYYPNLRLSHPYPIPYQNPHYTQYKHKRLCTPNVKPTNSQLQYIPHEFHDKQFIQFIHLNNNTRIKISSSNLELVIKFEKDRTLDSHCFCLHPFAHPNFVLLSTPVHRTAKNPSLYLKFGFYRCLYDRF